MISESTKAPALTGKPWAQRRPRHRGVRELWIYMLSVLGVLMLWQVTVTAFGNPVFVPTPVMVLGKGAVLLRSGEIFGHVGVSLGRILGGFALGSVLGAPIGLLMGNVRLVRVLLEPYVEFFRFVPSIAWLTPAVIWFGIGETPKVLIIMYTTVFIVIINTVVGVANVSSNKLWAARCLGATERQAFVYVVVPATLPFVLTGMRLAMGNSFATVVSAEMIAADQGMGFLIFNSRLWMATDTIFLTIVLLGALGFASDRCFRMLIRRFARQFGPAE